MNTTQLLNSSNTSRRPSYKIQPAYVNTYTNETIGDNTVFNGNPRQLDGVTVDDDPTFFLRRWESRHRSEFTGLQRDNCREEGACSCGYGVVE